jgi:DNA-binding MarR family transcriptional regulator
MAARRVTHLYDSALASCELKLTQFSILAELAHRGTSPPTMGELAQAMVMDRSTLGHNLRPIERDRLIELTASTEDRRSRRVRLTPAGFAKFEEASALWRTAQTRFESGFGVKPAENLRKVLRQVAALDFTTSA